MVIRQLYFDTWYGRLAGEAYETIIEPQLADFVSPEFERLCRDALPELYPERTFTDIGRWWYNEHEVDVVGLTAEGTIVAGECKFTNAQLDYSALSSLEGHADEIRWTPGHGGDVTRTYALFSRNEFTQSVREAAESRDDVRLCGLDRLVEVL